MNLTFTLISQFFIVSVYVRGQERSDQVCSMFYPRFHDYFVNKNVCDGPFLKVDRFQHLPGHKPISNISHESRTSSSLDTGPDGHTMAAWLDLVSDTTGWSLVDTGRMDEIVQGMSHPTTQ